MATCPPMIKIMSSKFSKIPRETIYVLTNVLPDSPSWIPIRIGVPTAPNETGVLCITRAHMTAASGGKPSTTSNGPATAAGVPNPDAPSIKAPNVQAIIMA